MHDRGDQDRDQFDPDATVERPEPVGHAEHDGHDGHDGHSMTNDEIRMTNQIQKLK
jgi:hypothetical protein